jgi:hypothetical protein
MASSLDVGRDMPLRKIFRSVPLLFGVLPVDLHNLALLSVIPSHDNSKNEQTAPTSFKHFPRLDGIHSCTLHHLSRGLSNAVLDSLFCDYIAPCTRPLFTQVTSSGYRG